MLMAGPHCFFLFLFLFFFFGFFPLPSSAREGVKLQVGGIGSLGVMITRNLGDVKPITEIRLG